MTTVVASAVPDSTVDAVTTATSVPGDYSSNFRIHNLLDVDLKMANDIISYGYWLKKPNDGIVPAHSVSGEFQLKDRIGWAGTEAEMDFKGQQGDASISVHMYVNCGTVSDNKADITGDTANFLLSVMGFNPKGNPMTVEFIIQPREK